MKKILMMLLLAAPVALFAQKYAQVDYFALVQAMPKYQIAQARLDSLGKTYENELVSIQKELEEEIRKYQTEINESTPENVRQRREQKIQGIRETLQQAYEDNQRAYQKKEQELLQPIYVMVAQAVKALANEEGYVYIIDKQAAQSTYIFLNDSLNEDVTNKVATKLGITLTKAAPVRPVAAE
jgi:outer membrane protein